MKHHIITVHHKIPHAFWGNLKPDNAIHLRENIHRSIHTIFQDDTPIQRIRRLLEVDKSTMHPEVYQVLHETLRKYEWILEHDVYRPELFNSDKFLQRWKR